MRRAIVVLGTVVVALFILPLMAMAQATDVIPGLSSALAIATRTMGMDFSIAAFAVGVAVQEEIARAEACRVLAATLLVLIPYVVCLKYLRTHAPQSNAVIEAPIAA